MEASVCSPQAHGARSRGQSRRIATRYGGSNVVVGQELDDVEITSSGNSVTVSDDLDEVTVSGSGNTVSSQGIEKKKDTGSGNTIS